MTALGWFLVVLIVLVVSAWLFALWCFGHVLYEHYHQLSQSNHAKHSSQSK